MAAACAEGDTVFRDVGELRVKESDRLAGVAELVRAFGAGAEVDGDDLVVHGRRRLPPGDRRRRRRPPHGHGRAPWRRLAAGAGPQPVIAGWEAVATSYPGFAGRPGPP